MLGDELYFIRSDDNIQTRKSSKTSVLKTCKKSSKACAQRFVYPSSLHTVQTGKKNKDATNIYNFVLKGSLTNKQTKHKHSFGLFKLI